MHYLSKFLLKITRILKKTSNIFIIFITVLLVKSYYFVQSSLSNILFLLWAREVRQRF
ncbi:hypothetical protein GLOIN_2v1632365 [Rhizophagus irregularis DAOM 181602=DAOM 197198]|uniref:Uncharacterized protein n=1 Tax=Rhizophagus irregularis (strain DAOM 181602 / DAOM 197198 / MUCL 43194) TaxID=747089 RepID=A0A2P4PTW4_RHIID|nr:hypothetical protein GLOIN_2v1632365 [Rhizophagus irregularis DAOM 181602=DAOM 197198]POG68843.1 hypothetical protein GLOIN_2v1632365 [Rhizophagus irregularis DAOM 181602=DAOM 197198]|eukprot:XP_025175709.1 hypothetical protein GLOIN_2v1632365 [Rhizophagus irregularis DAOM 181602=DAOM 197198]